MTNREVYQNNYGDPVCFGYWLEINCEMPSPSSEPGSEWLYYGPDGVEEKTLEELEQMWLDLEFTPRPK